MLDKIIRRFKRNKYADPVFLLLVCGVLLWVLFLYADSVLKDTSDTTPPPPPPAAAAATAATAISIATHPGAQINATNDTTVKAHSLAVLIQQSPVDQPHEMSRLHAIDQGYARWSTLQFVSSASSSSAATSVFAAIPEELRQTKSHSLFQHIQLLDIPTAPTVKQNSPMYRLISAFYSLTTLHQGVHEFILLCNTHTFVVIPNLQEFISRYASEDLFYSGNELAINYKSPSPLTFASGGAGIVLSHVSLTLMMVTWAMIQLPDLMIFLNRDSNIYDDCEILKAHDGKKRTKLTVNIFDRTSSLFTDIKCVMLFLSGIKDTGSESLRKSFQTSSLAQIQKIRIELSKNVNLELIKKEAKVYPFEVYLVTNEDKRHKGTMKGEKRVLISVAELLQCDARSKWEKGFLFVLISLKFHTYCTFHHYILLHLYLLYLSS